MFSTVIKIYTKAIYLKIDQTQLFFLNKTPRKKVLNLISLIYKLPKNGVKVLFVFSRHKI